MRNIKLTLAYEGTAYLGFQRQKQGPTIQGTLEESLVHLTGERPRVIGAGRTDAGVHALGQVVNFHTSSRIETGRFVPALNSLLPRDIAVLAAEEVPLAFHARRDAKRKTYTYRLWRPSVRPVFERDRSYHFPRPLDLAAMEAAPRLLVGRHDFAVFGSSGSTEVKTTVRTVFAAGWQEEGPLLTFTITADGFLYRMVRNIVGTLLEIGLGKHPPEWVEELLALGHRPAAGPAVPARGLFLVRVEY
ncbi:MAG: tRNA pseudouridine(38-40) synthase TruA [Firmicutes bacterium]|nr:tRNA pseudouridine(38-40) synthase TruA [Bacillota bacterium]